MDDVKPQIHQLPDSKRGIKREREPDPRAAEEERKRRQAKLGFAVPNWRNIRNSSQPDADRYLDYEMVKIRNSCESIVSSRERRLLSMPVYTYSANVLCRYKKDDKEAYVPIEIGIYGYSIEKGALCKPYHVLIDAGSAPVGYFNASKDHATNHKITFTPPAGYPKEARNDYKNIYKEMVKYTKAGERTILVADPRDLAQVQGTIEWIYEKASESDKFLPSPRTWTILPLVEYVASAYNCVFQRMLKRPKPAFVLYYNLKLRMENCNWDYDTSLMCDYHKIDKNQTMWCARNCAIRAIRCIEGKLEEVYKMYKLADTMPDAQAQNQKVHIPAHLVDPETLAVSLENGEAAPRSLPSSTGSGTGPTPSIQFPMGPAIIPPPDQVASMALSNIQTSSKPSVDKTQDVAEWVE